MDAGAVALTSEEGLKGRQGRQTPATSPSAPATLFHQSCDLGLQSLEGRQPSQRREILDELGQSVGPRGWMEPAQPPGTQAARLVEKLVEERLGICKLLQPVERRNREADLPAWVVCRQAESRLVKQEPGFLHADRDDTNRRRLCLIFQRPPDLGDTRFSWFPLGIAVHEQEVARIKLQGREDLLFESFWRLPESPQVRPLWLKGA